MPASGTASAETVYRSSAVFRGLFGDALGHWLLFRDDLLHEHAATAWLFARWARGAAGFAAVVLANVPWARALRQAVPFFFALVDDLRNLFLVVDNLSNFAGQVLLHDLSAAITAGGFVADDATDQIPGRRNLNRRRTGRHGRKNNLKSW